ncbi:sedoheptulokinase-like isoform X2 [Hyposmocoma kahamanoa]|uniref:sedoheptulokinase-like isoform X2 n=1 Tax=Hyposmocoma kahamanoa TaxID=1477025 RepID=UPI000E6D707D|nr:sedoheptulokinase-like isoform X2 [Hyposmocoma kahamanoa]
MADKQYILGMDIGTTSVKVCVYDPVTKELVAKQNKDTAANIPSDQGIEGNKQDVPKIVSAVHYCVSRLPRDILRHVTKIGVCGQMQGVVLWKNGAWEKIEKEGVVMRFEGIRENMSALYTWQDTRCKPEFLESLPKPNSLQKCYSGYGCTTLLWMLKHKPDKLKNFSFSATVQDFVVAMLCNLETPITSDQNAASWGYFNTEINEWNIDILKSIDFPVNLLPKVVKSGEFAGKLSASWNGIPEGTPVGAALGDLQCSILATLENEQDAVLNISTSAQLAIVVKSVSDLGCSTIEHLPYFNNTYLVVAASLNGGNVLATFVKMLQQWMLDLGCPIPQSKVWEKLISLGLAAPTTSPMKIKPHLLGERHDPTAKASVENIDLSNIQLGPVFKSLCDSLIENLHFMMPKEILRSANIKRIVGNGSGLSRNVVLQRAVEHYYSLPLEFTSGGDAAKGAAIAVLETVEIDD